MKKNLEELTDKKEEIHQFLKLNDKSNIITVVGTHQINEKYNKILNSVTRKVTKSLTDALEIHLVITYLKFLIKVKNN